MEHKEVGQNEIAPAPIAKVIFTFVFTTAGKSPIFFLQKHFLVDEIYFYDLAIYRFAEIVLEDCVAYTINIKAHEIHITHLCGAQLYRSTQLC